MRLVLILACFAVLITILSVKVNRIEREIETLRQRTLDLQTVDTAIIDRMTNISSDLTELSRLTAEHVVGLPECACFPKE